MKSLLRRVALWVLGLLVLALVIGFTTAHPIDAPVFLDKDHGFLIIAHKGGEGLAPGNTIEAFARGLMEGADILETDARLTADGHVVLFHDDSVEGQTDGSGRVEDLTLAEIRSLDAGYWWTDDKGSSYPYRGKGHKVPTLAEALAAFPGARFNVDMKTHSQEMVAAMVETIRASEAENRVLITSFDAETAQAFRREMPEVASSCGSSEVQVFYAMQLLRLTRFYTPPAAALQVPEYEGSIHVVTSSFIGAAHSRGMQVHVWTVNDEETMRRLIDLGVDGIVTDYPERLRAILGR